MSAASLGNGAALRPWKERVQSTLSSAILFPLDEDSASRGSGLSARPVLEMFSVVGLFGVLAVAGLGCGVVGFEDVVDGVVGFGRALGTEVFPCCGGRVLLMLLYAVRVKWPCGMYVRDEARGIASLELLRARGARSERERCSRAML